MGYEEVVQIATAIRTCKTKGVIKDPLKCFGNCKPMKLDFVFWKKKV